jgi:hypoxanthine phosphoribosyltransferase
MKTFFTYLGYVAAIFGVATGSIAFYRQWKALLNNRFTWRRVEKGITKLVAKMRKDNYNPDLVVGVGRSGGIIGGLIAGYLGAKPFTALNCKYENINKNGATVRKVTFDRDFQISSEYKKILLVEGATTAGDTPKAVLSYMQDKFDKNNEYRFAVLVREHGGNAPINYTAYEVEKVKKLPWHVPGWPTHLKHP